MLKQIIQKLKNYIMNIVTLSNIKLCIKWSTFFLFSTIQKFIFFIYSIFTKNYKYIILILCLSFLCFYMNINYFSNLIFLKKLIGIEYVTKDYNDCECFKSFKHGNDVSIPIIYENLFFINIYFKTLPYLSVFYNKIFICNCQCYYCLQYKDFIVSLYLFIIILTIILHGEI
jgi:hypothetical protein